VAARDEFPDAELERARFAAGEFDELAEGEGFVVGQQGEDVQRHRVEVISGARLVEVDLAGEGVLLFDEGAEAEEQPLFSRLKP
jgi:hypothetical protein